MSSNMVDHYAFVDDFDQEVPYECVKAGIPGQLTLHMFQKMTDEIYDYIPKRIQLTWCCQDIPQVFAHETVREICISCTTQPINIPEHISPNVKKLELHHTKVNNLLNIVNSNIEEIELDDCGHIPVFPQKQFKKIIIKGNTQITGDIPPCEDFQAYDDNCVIEKHPYCSTIRMEKVKVKVDWSRLIDTHKIVLNGIPTELPEIIPTNVVELSVSNCGLTSIPASIGNCHRLADLNISDNKITHLPIEIVRIRYETLQYNGNTIDNINNPVIRRWANRMDNTNNTIYNDNQNVHDSKIQQGIRDAITALMKISTGKQINYHKDKYLTDETKKAFDELLSTTNGYACDVTYKDLFYAVMEYAETHEHNEGIKGIMNDVIPKNVNVCFTGRISRLIDCLNGIADFVKIHIDNATQMQLIVKKTAEKHNTIDEYIMAVSKELDERCYDKEDISFTLDYAFDYFAGLYPEQGEAAEAKLKINNEEQQEAKEAMAD